LSGQESPSLGFSGRVRITVSSQQEFPVEGQDGLAARPPRTYLPQLDGLRALAVGAVIVYHVSAVWRPHLVSSPTPGLFIGVDVFFVLSGYLITAILLRELGATGTIGLNRFYGRRAVRLFPLLFLVVAVVTPALIVSHPEDTRTTLEGAGAALFYVSAWVRGFGVSELGGLGHVWSLSVEEHFYLLWPPLLSVLTVKWLRYRTAAVCALLIALTTYRLYMVFSRARLERMYNSPDLRMDQLLIGCLLALLLADVPPVSAVVRRAGNLAFWLSALGLVGAALVFTINHYLYYAVGMTWVGLTAAVVIGHLVIWPRSVMSRVLSRQPMVWIGRRSYGIYLWHFPILLALYGHVGSRPLLAAIVVGLTVTLAAVSYRFLEAPLLARRDRTAKRRLGSARAATMVGAS
jgi:peptidoglycan/LPS O-acetylase OafA/YrhL